MDVRDLRYKYQEPDGEPIGRLTKQWVDMEKVITRELELGVAKSGMFLGLDRQEKKGISIDV